MISLNQVVGELRGIAASNKFITTFYFGDILDYAGKTEQQHTSFVCTLLENAAAIKRTETTFRFGLYCFDWCELDNIEREKDVWSDTILIMTDFLAKLRDQYNYNWTVSPIAETRVFKERWGDGVAGCQTEVEVSFDYEADRCAIPTT